MSLVKKAMLGSRLHARSKVGLVDEMLRGTGAPGARDALEVGCGAGFVSSHLRRAYGLDVTGTDNDLDMVEYARRKRGEGPGIRFIQADSTALPFEDGSFDIVVAQNVLHHVKEWRPAAMEAARVLRKGGLFLFSDITGPGLAMRVLAGAGADHGFHDVEALISLLSECGLSLEYRKEPAAGKREMAFAFRAA